MPVRLPRKNVVYRNVRYFVADHQTGDTAHYPSAAQAMAAGRILAGSKLRAQGLTELQETERGDGCLYFVAADTLRTTSQQGVLVSVGRVN